MQIHLSKPGGAREGPFTLDEINRDLAAKKYNDSDYWAWYDGLGSWIPLHSIPGVKTGVGGATEFKPKPEEQYSIATEVVQTPEPEPRQFTPEPQPEPVPQAQPEAEPEAEVEPAPIASAPAPSPSPSPDPFPVHTPTPATRAEDPSTEMASAGTQAKVYSGMPVRALEHIFVFTSGDGPSLRESAVTSMMLLEMIGENPDAVRDRVPRDVFGKCNIGERIRAEGKVPASAWRAMSSLKPELVQKAKEAAYRTCVRTFKTENNDVVAVFLFYDKQKL